MKKRTIENLNIIKFLNLIKEKLSRIEFIVFDDFKKELENDGYIINSDFFAAFNILNRNKLLFIYTNRKVNKKFISMKKEFLDQMKRCTRDLDISGIQNKVLNYLVNNGPARAATISGSTGVSMFRLERLLPDFLAAGVVKKKKMGTDTKANYYYIEV